MNVDTRHGIAADTPDRSMSERVREISERARTGELGTLPIAAVLIVIWLVFQGFNANFLTSDNLVNLMLQSAASGIIALGVVLVLMIGQIDLSVGAVSGLGAALVAVSSMRLGLPVALVVLLTLCAGAAIGFAYGFLSARLGIPTFVLTLAGLLVALGLQLKVLGTSGTVNLPFESWLVRFSQQGFFSPVASYCIAVVVVLLVAARRFWERQRRLAVGLPEESVVGVVVGVVVLAVVLVAGAVYLNTNRGVPYTFALFLALVVVVDVLLRRTGWGRAVRAIGGNVEAARRAGLPVRTVTISVFVACSTLAAVGGILSAGRLAAANQGSGGTELSLTVIAAAVIGGASLFGGRGSAWSALVGILVIQSIASGLTLMNLDASVRYIITGVVLAGAVTIDAISRRNFNSGHRRS